MHDHIWEIPAPPVGEPGGATTIAVGGRGGQWNRRHGDLLTLDQLDGGYRLVETDLRP